MLSGFGLNLKGSISAPLGEKKMRKGFKLKKKKKTGPPTCRFINLTAKLQGFVKGSIYRICSLFQKQISRTFPGLKLNLTNLFIPEISKS